MKKVLLILIPILLMACSLTSKALPSATETMAPTPTETSRPLPSSTPTLPPITDSEFTELAQGTCQNLQTDLSNIASSREPFFNRYEMASEAFQKALNALSDLEVEETSAPFASQFMQSLGDLPELYQNYGFELISALEAAGLVYEDISYYAVTEEDKDFIVFANDIWNELLVDETVKMQFYSAKANFSIAANELNLGICSSVDPIFD
jgi:hypothetical protein